MSNGLNEAAPPDTVVEKAAAAPAGFWALALGSVGVVYGDIGTSPLYAFREAVRAASENGVPTRAW
jgi:KUP system potassium uptake protein